MARAAADKGRAILDEILDENSPRDSPLLERHNPTTNLLASNFGLVDRNDCRANAYGEATNRTTDTQMSNVLGAGLESVIKRFSALM